MLFNVFDQEKQTLPWSLWTQAWKYHLSALQINSNFSLHFQKQWKCHCHRYPKILRQTQKYYDGPRNTMTDPEIPWQTQKYHDRPRNTMTDPEILWQTQKYYDRPRNTMTDPEILWQTQIYYDKANNEIWQQRSFILFVVVKMFTYFLSYSNLFSDLPQANCYSRGESSQRLKTSCV